MQHGSRKFFSYKPQTRNYFLDCQNVDPCKHARTESAQHLLLGGNQYISIPGGNFLQLSWAPQKKIRMGPSSQCFDSLPSCCMQSSHEDCTITWFKSEWVVTVSAALWSAWRWEFSCWPSTFMFVWIEIAATGVSSSLQKPLLLHTSNLLFHWRCSCTILTFSLNLLKSNSIFRACPSRV